MHPAPIEAVDELVLQHFAFLTQNGFMLNSRPSPKDILRAGYQAIRYNSEHWAVEIYLEYREGYYTVSLIPLEHGEPRQVPFGHRTKWGLEHYLTQILGVQDEEIGRVHKLYETTLSLDGADKTSQSSQLNRSGNPEIATLKAALAKRVTFEFASRVFEAYSSLFARHLDEIVSSHPLWNRIDSSAKG